MQKYAKAFTTALIVALGGVGTALAQGDGSINYQAGITIAIAFLTSFSVVWAVPNVPHHLTRAVVPDGPPVWQKYLKAGYGALMAGLGALATAYTQGHGSIGWSAVIAIAITFFGALGAVWRIPNAAAKVAAHRKAAKAP